MADPIAISAARFPKHTALMPNPSPVYRYPKAHRLGRLQKQGVAWDLLKEGVKPRHIRKCLGISNRQLKKAKASKHQPQANE